MCQGARVYWDFTISARLTAMGSFVETTKDRWTKIYFYLPTNDLVSECLARPESFPSSHFKLFGESLHDDLKPFEAFTCCPYTKDLTDPYS